MARTSRVIIETPRAWDPGPPTLAKLAGSGLTPAHADLLQIEPLPRPPAGYPVQLGGFLIPYHDAAGKPTGFGRFRYLEEPPKLNGFRALAPGKPLRYAQPAGSLPEIYLPRLGLDWAAYLRSDLPLLVTEGELKAAAATAAGLPCLGLGGVWSWRANDAPLPALRAISWKGRQVTIAFDSDARSNDKVVQARNALSRELAAAGADVRILEMPDLLPAPLKTGLDDYLVHVNGGPDKLKALVAAAEPWAPISLLHELNEEVVLLRDQSRIYRWRDQRIMRPEDFIAVEYAPMRYVDNSGAKPVLRVAPQEWLKWRGRAESPGLTFAPGQPSRLDTGHVNTWTGWGVEPIEGDVSPWVELLNHLFQGEPESRRWFEQWAAAPLQKPGEKLYTAALLWSQVKGVGKTMIAYSLMPIHGKRHSIEIKNKDLRGDFNGWLAGKTLVYGDEITASDARVDADYLKGLITQHGARVNEKFQVPHTLPDFASYIFTSNHPDALFVEVGDRRYFVHEIRVAPLSRAFYDRYHQWLHKDNGPAHLFHHLLHLPMSGFHPRDPAPDTPGKARMLRAGMSGMADFVASLRDNTDGVYHNGTMYPFTLWTSAELLTLLDPERRTRITPTGLGREMQRQGFQPANNGQTVYLPKFGGQHLWCINADRSMLTAKGADVAAQYVREREGRGGARGRKC